MIGAVAVALALGGCVQQSGKGGMAFRDAAAPIYSVAAFEPGRLEGRWVQAAAFDATTKATCGPGALEFSGSGADLAVNGQLCLRGRMVPVSGRIGALGQGRLAVPGMENWWVLWVDSGYRTLAVGTPSGRFGFVLDRGQVPSDRLTAAHDIFEFNGYRADALGPV